MSAGDRVVSVQLKDCRNLRSTHGDKFTCFARVELGGTVLGESVRGECGGVIPVKLTVDVSCDVSDPTALDRLSKHPLLVTFLEVLPKDKKAKEEKTSVLGQTSIDLLSFIRNQSNTTTHSITATLHPSSHDGAHPAVISEPPPGVDVGLPEVDIEVTVPQALLGVQEITQSNILSLRLRSLHSLPDSWQPGTFPHTFTLALPLPSTDTPSNSATPTNSLGISVPQGILKLGPDKDTSCLATSWKWPGAGTGKASLVPECPLVPHPLEDEAGELNTKQDAKFRQLSECEKPRVSWNSQHRVWLTHHTTHTLLSQLSQCPIWPVEIGRYSLPQTTGKGKAKEEEPVLSHHAVAYLNLAPLLYPGATHICGAYTLHPFTESEVADKIKRSYSILLTQSANAASSKKTAGGKRAPSSTKLQEPSGMLGEGADSSGEGGEARSEAHVYVDANTYVVLEIELEKPLIPKRPVSVLAERISEYIPSRPPIPRRVGGVKRAVLDYHQKTGDIASVLLSEFRELFGEGVTSGSLSQDQDAVNERRRKLLFHLNSSGKYHVFKEQLKVSVVKLVREKYLTQAKTENKAQLQSFLSELYVFLTDQMHAGLDKVLNLEDAAPPPPTSLNSDLLKTFAFEAEQCGDYDLAHQYYKERVTSADHISDHWYDYGIFCLLVSDMDRSEQCLKEAVSLDQTLVPALLLYGMVSCLDDRFSEAEHFFELSTTADPTNIIAWTMRGLHYELAGNGVYQEMCFQEATKLNLGQSAKTFILPNPKKRGSLAQQAHAGSKTMASQSKASISSRMGGNLKQQSTVSTAGQGGVAGGEVGMPQALVESTNTASSAGDVQKAPPTKNTDETSKPLDQQQKPGTESIVSFNDGGTTFQGGQDNVTQGDSDPHPPPTSSTHNLTSASGASIKSGNSSIPNGGQQPTTNLTGPPASLGAGSVVRQDSASTGGTVGGGGAPTASIFLQTGSYLLDVHALKFAEMSLAHELAGCNGDLPPQFHIAEARLHMHREIYDRAEACLKKAIALDFQNSNAWSLLGHTHYLTGDFPSAKDAYERTINFVTPPTHVHSVFLRLADIYLKDHEYERAKETYLRACRRSPTSRTWRGVGVACYQLGDLGQSEDALCEANILNNMDPVVWAYLTMVCLKTKRPVEAEQAFKFAVKAGLNDSTLISEIRQLHRTHAPSIELPPLPQTTVSA